MYLVQDPTFATELIGSIGSMWEAFQLSSVLHDTGHVSSSCRIFFALLHCENRFNEQIVCGPIYFLDRFLLAHDYDFVVLYTSFRIYVKKTLYRQFLYCLDLMVERITDKIYFNLYLKDIFNLCLIEIIMSEPSFYKKRNLIIFTSLRWFQINIFPGLLLLLVGRAFFSVLTSSMDTNKCTKHIYRQYILTGTRFFFFWC